MGWNQISGKVSRKRVSRYDGVPLSGSALYCVLLHISPALYDVDISRKFNFKIPNSFANIATAMSGMCIVFNYENICKKSSVASTCALQTKKIQYIDV